MSGCPLSCPISHIEANHHHLLTEFADWVKNGRLQKRAPPPTASPTTICNPFSTDIKWFRHRSKRPLFKQETTTFPIPRWHLVILQTTSIPTTPPPKGQINRHAYRHPRRCMLLRQWSISAMTVKSSKMTCSLPNPLMIRTSYFTALYLVLTSGIIPGNFYHMIALWSVNGLPFIARGKISFFNLNKCPTLNNQFKWWQGYWYSTQSAPLPSWSLALLFAAPSQWLTRVILLSTCNEWKISAHIYTSSFWILSILGTSRNLTLM